VKAVPSLAIVIFSYLGASPIGDGTPPDKK
jgi:hypothetical protein